MVNNFRNGYTCETCLNEKGFCDRITPMIPIYRREDGKFIFDDTVKCPKHGYAPAIALRKV
jgi:uncharacterized protein YqkB